MFRYKDNGGQSMVDVHDMNSNAFLGDSLSGKVYVKDMDSSDNSVSPNEFDSDSRSHSPNMETELNPIDD